MHGLRDAPGNGTIRRHADDQRAFAAHESHVSPNELDQAGHSASHANFSGGHSASLTYQRGNQRRRTLTVSFCPTRSVECLLMPFQFTRSDTVTPNTCAMRESVSPLRTW